MRFAFLGSGSKGNAGLVEADGTCVLVDCGFSLNETVRRLERCGKSPQDLAAVLVTHEHSDHIAGVARLAKKFQIPVWMTPGTYAGAPDQNIPGLRLFSCHEQFTIGGLSIEPVPVPHDAREPSQFVLCDGRFRLGILTDTGHITAHIRSIYAGCDGLVIECNHDRVMLETGPYHHALKNRVGGQLGHLNNVQSADLLADVAHSKLQHVVAVHISEKNNRPDLARQALAGALGSAPDEVDAADQAAGLDWRTLS